MSGVYGGQSDSLPMMTLFDKQITLRMGHASVKRWADDILSLLLDDDVLGVDGIATRRLTLDDAPDADRTFQAKQDGIVTVVMQPGS